MDCVFSFVNLKMFKKSITRDCATDGFSDTCCVCPCDRHCIGHSRTERLKTPLEHSGFLALGIDEFCIWDS